jgi:hypothetical protein
MFVNKNFKSCLDNVTNDQVGSAAFRRGGCALPVPEPVVLQLEGPVRMVETLAASPEWHVVKRPNRHRIVGTDGAIKNNFRLAFARRLTYSRSMSRVVPPVIFKGVRYSVLRLSEDRGNVAFLLRSESGELFGVYRRNAQEALSVAPLKLFLSTDNPFRGLDLFETESGGLIVRV